MTLSLDDLGRATYTAVEDFFSTYKVESWDDLEGSAEKKRLTLVIALAVAERFAEEVNGLIGSFIQGQHGAFQVHRSPMIKNVAIGQLELMQEELGKLLSSLRAEAGQGQKGSET